MSKHQFELTSYSAATYCSICFAFIGGTGKQGYSCKVCGKNIHKKCLEKIVDDCGKQNGERQISGPVIAQSLVPNKQPQPPPPNSRGNPNGTNVPPPQKSSGFTSPPPMKGNNPPPMAPRPANGTIKSASAQTIPTYNPSQRVEEQENIIRQQMETIKANENAIREQEIRLEANAKEIEEQEKILNDIQVQIENLTKQFDAKQVSAKPSPSHGSLTPSKSASNIKANSLQTHRPSQSTLNKVLPDPAPSNPSDTKEHGVTTLQKEPSKETSAPPSKNISSPPVKQVEVKQEPPAKQTPAPVSNNPPNPSNPPVKNAPTPIARQASDQPKGNPGVKESQPSTPPVRPNRPTIAQPKRLEDASYYFGNIDRKQAEEYLSGFGGNCYLIRDSSVKGAYAISYLHKQKGFNHTLILQVNGGYKLQEANDIFPTVWDVINKDPELATFTPLDKHKKKSIVKVQIPEVKVVASIPSESNISVNDLVKTMLAKAGITSKPEEYGLYSPEDNLWLPGDKNFASVVQAANYKAPLILQRRDQIHVKVKYNNKEYPLNLKKDATVKETIEKIKEIAKVTSPVPHVLQVIKADGEEPIIMDEKKIIRSYNLNITDALELKEEKTEKEEKEETGKKGKQIFVKVESQDASSLLKIGLENTVQDLTELFLRKNPVSNPSGYGLIKSDGKKKKKQENLFWLDPNKTLASYGIKNKDSLIFRQKLRNRSVSKMEGIIKTQKFGVDPSSLDCVVDAGYKVPRVLVVLKMAIVKHKGFEVEGIFRLSGSESKLKDIKYQLNTNSFEDSDDMHCCASLIKRWYGEIPNRLFSSLAVEQIDAVQNDVNESWALVKKLPEPSKSLYLWLIELLCNVARNSEITKMGPANLAICVAPQMMDINIDNPMEAILMNQQLCNLVKNTIVYKLRDQELGALGNYARAPSDPEPEIEVSQDN